ncbi:MAG: hypothetical protein E7412_03920 [Ruminococcaceae bacterium]|nr:hypothetical protein [Oscillospiraceae bacterium]
MENEHIEVVIKNRKRKKRIIASVLFCVIVAICVSIFFSNHISKDKIKIKKTKVVELYHEIVSDGFLVENEADCAVDVEIKGDFYDKDNNWLGEQIYSYTLAPNIKSVINPAWSLSSLSWARQIERDEYTLVKCKKSNQKMINVGFSADNDITVRIDKEEDKVTLTNNTNHDINVDVRLKEIYYIKNNYIAEYYVVKTTELIPANKKISVDNYYYDDEFQKTKEKSEKMETFFYGYDAENYE